MGNMKTLHLTLKKKWFDMILSGEKKEEYRELKDYWINRFYKNNGNKKGPHFIEHYDQIIFKNGYSKNCPEMLIECLGIDIGETKIEWSGISQPAFVIKLGKILSKNNC